MYTPKLMFLIFNLIIVVTAIILISYGVSDYTPFKLKPLENATDLVYFTKIWLYSGTALIIIAFLGFWSVDMENRIALITYKILLYLAICIQVVLVCYFSLNSSNIGEHVQNQLKLWVDEYDVKNRSAANLDGVQTYLKCCEMIIKTPSLPVSCCPIEFSIKNRPCTKNDAYNVTCTKTGSTYFQKRSRVRLSFLFRAIGPQIIAVIFAEMVAAKILLLQNLMRGKLS